MALQPSASVGIGLATGGIAFAVFQMSLPRVTDVRTAEPENMDVQGAERGATWVSAGIVTGVALLVQDATVFVIGGSVVIALAWLYRHANQVNPLSGFASGVSVPGAISPTEPADSGYMDIGPFSEAA